MSIRQAVAVVVGALLLGVVGVALTLEVLILRSPRRDPRAEPMRLWGLTALTTGIVFGLVGAVVGVVRGMGNPGTAYFAAMEGGIIAAVPGVVLGAIVGAVLAADLRRRVLVR